MSAPNMGGPAFPTDSEHQSGPNTWHYEGMTLWDHYAASALIGLYASLQGPPQVTGADLAADAELVGQIADAMLAEHAKRVKAES